MDFHEYFINFNYVVLWVILTRVALSIMCTVFSNCRNLSTLKTHSFAMNMMKAHRDGKLISYFRNQVLMY